MILTVCLQCMSEIPANISEAPSFSRQETCRSLFLRIAPPAQTHHSPDQEFSKGGASETESVLQWYQHPLIPPHQGMSNGFYGAPAHSFLNLGCLRNELGCQHFSSLLHGKPCLSNQISGLVNPSQRERDCPPASETLACSIH